MGFFPTLAGAYIIFAFVFQAIAVGFVSLDKRCASKRLAWAALTLFTGPIGIAIYLLKGRNSSVKDLTKTKG